jgi:hypothetical protein
MKGGRVESDTNVGGARNVSLSARQDGRKTRATSQSAKIIEALTSAVRAAATPGVKATEPAKVSKPTVIPREVW